MFNLKVIKGFLKTHSVAHCEWCPMSNQLSHAQHSHFRGALCKLRAIEISSPKREGKTSYFASCAHSRTAHSWWLLLPAIAFPVWRASLFHFPRANESVRRCDNACVGSRAQSTTDSLVVAKALNRSDQVAVARPSSTIDFGQCDEFFVVGLHLISPIVHIYFIRSSVVFTGARSTPRVSFNECAKVVSNDMLI